MKNKVLCRFISMICALTVLLSYSCTAFAQDNAISKNSVDVDENYYITSIDNGYEEVNDSVLDINEYSIDVEKVIADSVNVKRAANNSYSGSFISDKYSAGIFGYKYQIKFNWTAKVSKGNYVFDKITNYKIVTYTNYLLLAMTWESYSYKITKKTYSFNGSRSAVTCYTNYTFNCRDKTTHNNSTMYGTNKKTFTMDQLL